MYNLNVNSKETLPTKEEALLKFRQEILELVKAESETAHFGPSFNPDDLDESDMILFRKFQAKTLDASELRARITMDIDDRLNESQKELTAYIANKLQEQM